MALFLYIFAVIPIIVWEVPALLSSIPTRDENDVLEGYEFQPSARNWKIREKYCTEKEFYCFSRKETDDL